MAGAYGDWTPLTDRGGLFPEELDGACSWQFGNFRVA
jgi:homospermidine synthase